MTSLQPAAGRPFRYSARRPDGGAVADIIHAEDERTALRALAGQGLIVTGVWEVGARGARLSDRGFRGGERVLVMQQLALLLEAGVPLLEALQTLAAGLQAQRGRRQLEAAMDALRGGAALGEALERHVPGFPAYVYPLVRVGEASGRTPEVLRRAAEQMAYEDRLRRDLINALTYPAFLAGAGTVAVAFIFVEIVPRFSDMLAQSRSHVPTLSRWVLGAGTFANAHGLAVGLALLAAAVAIGAAGTSASVRRSAYETARGLPLIGAALRAREVLLWARLTALGLEHGVGLLGALALARAGVPAGPFARGLLALEGDLAGGAALEAAVERRTRLSAMDVSLIRAGQRSGALARMFAVLADSYDAKLKDDVKRATALAEPITIGVISIFVGLIVLSLVLALSSLYESVG